MSPDPVKNNDVGRKGNHEVWILGEEKKGKKGKAELGVAAAAAMAAATSPNEPCRLPSRKSPISQQKYYAEPITIYGDQR